MKKRAFIVKRFDGCYIPFDDISREALNKVSENECIEVKISNSRLLWQHKRFFLALEFIYHNMPENFKEIYPTSEKLRKDLLKLAGHYETVKSIDGTERIEVLSMDFATVKQDEFEKLYSAIIDIALKYFITNEETQRILIDLT